VVSRPILGSDFAISGGHDQNDQGFEFLFSMLLKMDDVNEYEKCAKVIIHQGKFNPFVHFIEPK
jgi:hypothetical protein